MRISDWSSDVCSSDLIPTSRGMITDRNGEPLAVSTPVESIWANPQELLKHPGQIPELAEILGLNADDLGRRLTQRADKEFLSSEERRAGKARVSTCRYRGSQ